MKDPLQLRVKRPKKKRKKIVHRNSKETNLDTTIVYIVRKISRGDFNPNSISDQIKASVARSHGAIDAENNILKEEYLQCKTKRVKY